MPSVSRPRVWVGLVSLIFGLAAFGVAQMRDRVWTGYEAEMQDPVEDSATPCVEALIAGGPTMR